MATSQVGHKLFMTLSLNIGNLFNDSSSHALVDELRKRTSEEEILDFEEKFNSKNDKNLHIYICRFLKNRLISRGVASKWLITIIKNKESKIDALQKLNNQVSAESFQRAIPKIENPMIKVNAKAFTS